MAYIFTNILGSFVLEQGKVIETGTEQKLLKKYQNAKRPEAEAIKQVLEEFKKKEYSERFHKLNLEMTKKSVKEAISSEFLIIEAVNNIDDISRIINMLTKRLREWYSLYYPEYEHFETDNEKFVAEVLKSKKKETAMGAEFSHLDISPIIELAKGINSMQRLKEAQEKYLEKTMQHLCPNISAVAGTIIGARLLVHARSLKRLAMLPASTVQILGAEQALFRHLRTGAKAPRHGLIIAHPLLATAPQEMHGKIARGIADKISIAAKIDYFKGEFIGEKLRKELETKFKK
ncbi:MAG TPA: NOP5/NOP56 family protein [Candidatus Nanoarchaeia archaeon]|nr:NOP5/NOP56 family protein [Candidatus Nanoarchaeia archaeon]